MKFKESMKEKEFKGWFKTVTLRIGIPSIFVYSWTIMMVEFHAYDIAHFFVFQYQSRVEATELNLMIMILLIFGWLALHMVLILKISDMIGVFISKRLGLYADFEYIELKSESK